VTDKPAPITTKLAQIQAKDNLLGENITIGALKNLVTDKPAPITTKLAQIKAKDSLLGENITIGNLKNRVTDKPAPITVKLAQIQKRDPTLTVDGDTVNGMNGDEEIHGDAMVGGANIKFGKKQQHWLGYYSQKTDEGDDEDDDEVQRGRRDFNNGDLHRLKNAFWGYSNWFNPSSDEK